MGWEALDQWGHDVARIERLAGGVANDVWSVRLNGQLAVGRLGTRSDADFAWETEFLQYLGGEGHFLIGHDGVIRWARAELTVTPLPKTEESRKLL